MLGLKPFVAVALLGLFAVPLLAPPGTAGVFVDDVISSDTPLNVKVDRSDGVHNVITWDPPSDTDGRTIFGYYLYRYPSNAFYSPLQVMYLGPAGTSSYSDAFSYPKDTTYFLSAMFENSAGTRTESVLVGPIRVNDTHNCIVVAFDGNSDDPKTWPVGANAGCLM